MRDEGKRNILGVRVNVIDYEAVVERVIAAARRGEPLSVTALAVHGIMTGVSHSSLRTKLNGFEVITPDGQPVRWALNLLHRADLKQRVYGPELMLGVCRRAALDGLPIYLYGSTSAMIEMLAEQLEARVAGLRIAGVRPSLFRPMSDLERAEVVDDVRASGARIVFVGLGCPRQEAFVYEMCSHFARPTLAVGAAFAFHSGTIPMAPAWMQAGGLEWLYRLWKEPFRLWRRYVVLNPLYVACIAAQWLKVVHFDATECPAASAEPLWG
jgi:exopolysaccharide biosynthesis WecB/TagA/CpsF family protein